MTNIVKKKINVGEEKKDTFMMKIIIRDLEVEQLANEIENVRVNHIINPVQDIRMISMPITNNNSNTMKI